MSKTREKEHLYDTWMPMVNYFLYYTLKLDSLVSFWGFKWDSPIHKKHRFFAGWRRSFPSKIKGWGHQLAKNGPHQTLKRQETDGQLIWRDGIPEIRCDSIKNVVEDVEKWHTRSGVKGCVRMLRNCYIVAEVIAYSYEWSILHGIKIGWNQAYPSTSFSATSSRFQGRKPWWYQHEWSPASLLRCFRPPKGLLIRCLGVQIPTHKVFGRLGSYLKEILLRNSKQNQSYGSVPMKFP